MMSMIPIALDYGMAHTKPIAAAAALFCFCPHNKQQAVDLISCCSCSALPNTKCVRDAIILFSFGTTVHKTLLRSSLCFELLS